MKKHFILLNVVLILLSFIQINAQQDPYTRIKALARDSPVLKEKIPNTVIINANHPLYKVMSRPPIPFKPFELIDRTGRPMNPDSLVTLPSGNQITLKNYLVKLNELEQQLNLNGYTLREDSKKMVLSKMYTDTTYKKAKIKLETPVLYVNNVAKEEKNKGLTNVKIAQPNPKIADLKINNRLLKKINEESPWSVGAGNPDILSAELKLNFIRSAMIYAQNYSDIQRNKSTMKLNAKAEINGSLFGNSFSIFSATAVAESAADKDIKKTINASVNVLGQNLYNKNIPFDAKKSAYTESYTYAKSLDKSVGIEIPIFGPITFVGNIGVRGSVGLEYNINVNYTPEISFSIKPLGELSAYAEAGIGFAGIVSVGVGGNLVLIRANMDFSGALGVANLYTPVANSFPFYYKYKLGMDLTLMQGNLYLFGRLCTPSFWGLPQWCEEAQHEIFSWDGYRINTTLAEASNQWELK